MLFKVQWDNNNNGFTTSGYDRTVAGHLARLDKGHTIRCREWVVNYTPTEYCQCGRRYDYSNSGAIFRQPLNTIRPTSPAELYEFVKQPVVCQICYYTYEYNKGRWCPRWVKQQLGIKD